MKTQLVLFMVFILGLSVAYAGEVKNEIPLKQTLSAGEELRVPLDNSKIKRVAISMHNVLDSESVVYRSYYAGGKERPENEVGPKFVRTVTLQPRISDEQAKRRLDRKKIVIDTSKTDEIIIKVEAGKVDIEIEAEKKRI